MAMGRTALLMTPMLASEGFSEAKPLAELLVRAGADPNATSGHGYFEGLTPLASCYLYLRMLLMMQSGNLNHQAATAVAELIFLLVFESCRVLHYTSGDEVSEDDLVMTGSHIRAQEAALTNFPAPPGDGGTFLEVTWEFIKFFDDYPEARGGNEFLSLIFNLHAMTKDLTSLGLPTGAAEAGRDDEAEVKEE